MNKQEAEALIASIESMSQYVFYRDMYLTVERAKVVLSKLEESHD